MEILHEKIDARRIRFFFIFVIPPFQWLHNLPQPCTDNCTHMAVVVSREMGKLKLI